MPQKNIYKNFHEYCDIYISRLLGTVGFDVLNPNFRLTPLTYFVILDTFSFLFINGYNILVLSKDIKSTCYNFLTYCFGFIMIGRIANGLINTKMFQKLRDVMFSFTFDEDTEGEELEKYLWYGKTSKILGSIGMTFALVANVLFIVPPLVIWFATGRQQLSFGLFLSVIEADSSAGFFCNYIYDTFQGLFVPQALIGYLNMNLLYVICACFQLDVLVIKLQKLDKQLRFTDFGKKSKRDEICEILKLHQELNEYLAAVEELYVLESFNSILFFILGIALGLFICVKEIWVVGYLIIVPCSYMIFINSLFGVAIEIKSDTLVRTIYAIQWHLMTVEDKKLMLQFLQAAQNPVQLSYGGLFPLNLESFSKICKSIYTYLMFLRDMDV
ncbi:odorant receptor 43a-like [Culicoides brevitarsis]|uniref:odorant receptor 43a-like n=1 Tax=Culicoides brevitarsis TaxID=469753 RepID=UPI00307B2F5E